MGVTKELVESTLKSKMNPSHLGKGLQVSMDPENKTRHKRDWREIAPISSVSSVLDAIWSPSDLEQWIVYPYTPHLHYEIIDISGGCGASFTIEIVSEQFVGKRLLERHRMVNAALAEEMKEIHALSITKALTDEQWKQETQKSQAAA